MRRYLWVLALLMLVGTGWGVLVPPPASKAATAPLHEIKASGQRLYDSATGQTFIPRGANYVRLAQASDGGVYHSTFEPGRYNATAARAFLDQMRHDGYNTVRVFIDNGGNSHGIGRGSGTADLVYGPYMDNVAAFVRDATARGVYVMPVLEWFPTNDYYWLLAYYADLPEGTRNMDGVNPYVMDRGRAAAKAEYMKNFAAALLERIGRDNAASILAYQADNELYFDANKAPFDRLSGTVTPLNGITYNMAVPAERQQAADASTVEYSHRLKRALRQADPDALMTIGFFTNRAVGKAGFDGLMTYCSSNCSPGVDYRVPGRPAQLSIYGAADFIDVHLYPRGTGAVLDELNTIEISRFAKSYLIGELGAVRPYFNNDIIAAAYGMRDSQILTCRSGAKGWLFWTWDTYENLASQPLYFKLNETRGAVNGQLAPIVRPDPCR